MGPNMNRAQVVIRRLRARGEIVIDPTAVGPRRRWQQRDWRLFWKEVIQRYAMRVVFVDGWEYSSGCVYEYLTAVRAGIPTYDQRRRKLTVPRGSSLIRDAVRDVRLSGGNTALLRRVLNTLTKTKEQYKRAAF
jgi:hypothetical protein